METGISQSPLAANEQRNEPGPSSMSQANPNIPQKRSQSPHGSREDASGSAGREQSKKQRKSAWKGQNRSFKGHGRKGEKKATQGRNTNKEAKQSRDKQDSTKESEDQSKPIYAIEFSKEEIAAEERRPKKKVAMMIGYCGTGYKGLQIMPDVKTVEGDIFGALVAAKAISKANASDHKKSQLVRCARTDKGVHAGGNVLSLKMIIEDEDIVQKINDQLPPQIRIWGIEPTINSFSAYQQCDSRVYEYLIPTHCFVPPHPQTFLAKRLEELAVEADDIQNYHLRQEDAANFWTETEEYYVQPVLNAMDPQLRFMAVQQLFVDLEANRESDAIKAGESVSIDTTDVNLSDNRVSSEQNINTEEVTKDTPIVAAGSEESVAKTYSPSPLELAIRSIKNAHHKAKLAYRISPARLARVKSILNLYVGTWRYHNYTVSKRISDPSSKRHIKSFVVHGDPFLIGDTEWLSLKVHGQSFMMNQIRKMVLMASMMVRCGTHEDRIQDSFNAPKMIIPRAPALGLLLERPIFDAYNKYGRFKGANERGEIEFDKYQAEMDAFKQKEIYERMWKDEAEHQVFENFFAGLDSLHSSQLYWTSSLGLDAISKKVEGAVEVDVEKALGEDEAAEPGGEEG